MAEKERRGMRRSKEGRMICIKWSHHALSKVNYTTE